MSLTTIYKLTRQAEWEKAQKTGVFYGYPDDLRDGFIHFSTAGQLRATAEKHFRGQNDLLLLAVEPDVLGSSLKWEVSRGGEKFPHLYAELTLDTITRVEPLARDASGALIFPSEIP